MFGLTRKSPRFAESLAEVANPERGWYVGYDLARAGDAGRIYAGGRTLAMALVQLDAYRDDMALPGLFVAQLERGLVRVREAGIKVVLRFRYNSSAGPDASKATVLSHIRELAPLLKRNADVIAVIQMGMVGAWGEGHSSTNGLDNDADRSEILHAQLAAWPGFISVRTPGIKRAYLERCGVAGGARIGFFDDCYLASASDQGTYPDAADHAFFDHENTPVGGETCAIFPPRSDGRNALVEMAKDRVSYLNAEYNQAVIAVWAATGYHAEISVRLGYRLVITTAKVTPTSLDLRMVNRGFAAPFNARPAYLVFSGTRGQRNPVLLAADVRTWTPGNIAVTEHFATSMAPDVYRVSLWLPDAAMSLSADPRYAIRCANDGTWDAATGENALGEVRVTGVA